MTRSSQRRRWSSHSLGSSVAAGVAIQAALIISGVGAARLLGPENRGFLALIVLFPFATTQLGGLGLPMATTFFIARAPERARAIARTVVIPAAVQAVVLTALNASIFLLIFRDDSHAVQVAAALTLAMVPATLAEQYGLAILQGQQRFRAFNVLRTIAVFLYSGGIVGMLIVGNDSLVAVATVWTTAYALSAITTVLVVVRSVRSEPGTQSGPPLKEMTRFGLSGLLGWVSPIEGMRADQQVVGLLLSPVALGLYVVAQSFTNLPRFVAQSIGMVGYPTISGAASEREGRRAMWRFFWIAVALCAAIVVPLELAMGTLVELFYGSEFAAATDLARILLVAAFLMSIRRTLADGARGLGLPTLGTIAEASMWVVLVPLFPLLAARSGAEGVGVALTLAAAVALAVLIVPLASAWPRSVRRQLTSDDDPGERAADADGVFPIRALRLPSPRALGGRRPRRADASTD